MLLLAQGTPMIFSGDEFCSSQAGNNNPYCQDNETGWVDWKALEKNAEIFEYFKFLLKLRFDHRVLHNPSTFKLMDYISCGYPDLSCHGREAWRPDFTGHSHILGMLYCGQYDKTDKNSPFIYVCYNMHWMAEEIALPKLPDGLRWKMISDTESVSKIDNTDKKNNSVEKMSERSVRIYISETDPDNKSKRKLKRK
jgi:glycogen operon protein